MPARESLSRRILNDLRALILSGQLKPGDRLPSMRQLREQYDCSETPIKAALRDLHTLELVEGHQGLANFVADPLPDWATAKADAAPAGERTSRRTRRSN